MELSGDDAMIVTVVTIDGFWGKPSPAAQSTHPVLLFILIYIFAS